MTSPAVDVDSATRDFFKLHWSDLEIGCSPPRWRTWDRSGRPDEAELGGCYAIYEGAELLYVGVAVTEGKNASQGKKYGLLSRLQRHVLKRSLDAEGRYPPLDRKGKEHWANLDCIRMIGFPAGQRYLAAALEVYLISRLQPKINVQARWVREAKASTANLLS